MLAFLRQMKTLTAAHLKALLGSQKSRNTIYRYLRELTGLGLVGFHACGRSGGIGSLERLYFLTKKGFGRTAENDPSKVDFKNCRNPLSDFGCRHRILLLDFWVSLLVGSRQSAKYSPKAFLPEWETFGGSRIVLRFAAFGREDSTIRPDATFILENALSKREALFFLEIDAGTESLISKAYPCVTGRLERYKSAFKTLAFRRADPSFHRFAGARLLFVTSSPRRIDRLLRRVSFGEDLRDAFLFSTHEEIRESGAISGRYRKQGFEGAVGIDSKPM